MRKILATKIVQGLHFEANQPLQIKLSYLGSNSNGNDLFKGDPLLEIQLDEGDSFHISAKEIKHFLTELSFYV